MSFHLAQACSLCVCSVPCYNQGQTAGSGKPSQMMLKTEKTNVEVSKSLHWGKVEIGVPNIDGIEQPLATQIYNLDQSLALYLPDIEGLLVFCTSCA